MGDEESRREDAKIEDLLDRARRNGQIADCYACGNEDWVKYGAYDDESLPLCKKCYKEHNAQY